MAASAVLERTNVEGSGLSKKSLSKLSRPVSAVPQDLGQIDKGRASRSEGKRHTFGLSTPPAGNIFAPGARL